MYILIVTATYNEINSTIEWMKRTRGEVAGHEVDILITGVGSVATTYALQKQISWRTPELIIHAGIGGSFKQELTPGSIVAVKDEVFADLGAFDGHRFDDVFDLGLTDSNEEPFNGRMLRNTGVAEWNLLGLPLARGATVNCITAGREQLGAIAAKYDPDVESMEGAALHYVCLMEEIPFIQVRSISNFVGERDKTLWKMPEAIASLNKHLHDYLNFLK
jgi:futalosine hydrolase